MAEARSSCHGLSYERGIPVHLLEEGMRMKAVEDRIDVPVTGFSTRDSLYPAGIEPRRPLNK